MKSLEENYAWFKKLNTVAFGVGVDSSPSNKAWAASMNIKKTPLLSDFWPHGAVAQKYGVFRDKEGVSERANIIADENQKVIFFKIYPDEELPDIDEVKHLLKTTSKQSQPGNKAENNKGDAMQAYCMKDRKMIDIKNPKSIIMKNGRPATTGVCPICGTKVYRIGKSK